LEKDLHVSTEVQKYFEIMDVDGSFTVSSQFLINFMDRTGLLKDDVRLKEMFEYLESINAVEEDHPLTINEFNDAIHDCCALFHRALDGSLRVPDFKGFSEAFRQVYNIVEPNNSGHNATYIPQLAEVDPNQFAISVTTIDGQHFSIGDSDKQFCIQSCSKPISYLIGLRNFGEQYVHNHVGMEPSGHAFNYMGLKAAPLEGKPGRAVPHNPCINAGAIMMCSMVYPEIDSRAERLEKVMNFWKELSGG